MTKMDEILFDVRNQLGAEFVSSEVVGVDGFSIASTSMRPDVDFSVVAARMAMVMKLSSKVSAKMGMGAVEDNLVTTDKAFVLARFIGDGSYYWRMSVTKDAILGVVRMLMNEYADQLWNSIPH